MYIRRRDWWALVWRWCVRLALAQAGGAACAAGVALALHAAGARLPYFSRGWLLAPLYALPALAASALAAHSSGTTNRPRPSQTYLHPPIAMWCSLKLLRIPWPTIGPDESILKELKITTRLSAICRKFPQFLRAHCAVFLEPSSGETNCLGSNGRQMRSG